MPAAAGEAWSHVPVNPAYAGEGITAIQPFAQQFPKDGTLLMGGVHLQPGIWLKYTRFERVILLHNLSNQGNSSPLWLACANLPGSIPTLSLFPNCCNAVPRCRAASYPA